MIEKTYSRPAIGDVAGYTSRPDLPDEMIMQVRIEDTLIEIPVDPAKKEETLQEYPPGSQVSASFYNCEWHIEGKAIDSRISRPRVGISISELLKDHASPAPVEIEPAGPIGDPGMQAEELPEDYLTSAKDYLNEIEVDFQLEADELLKSIHLSHLKIHAQQKA